MLICPYCEQPLIREERVFHCLQGHSFDVASDGYLNLLSKPTKLQADTKEMLAGRRRFLERGYYAPLTEKVSEIVGEWLRARDIAGDDSIGGVLDAGCGEGYFTRALARELTTGRMAQEFVGDSLEAGSASPTVRASDGVALRRQPPIFGLDLARDGVRMAARHARQAPGAEATGERGIVWLVGNIKDRLPFASASMSCVTNILAPHNPQEFARILKIGGLLLVVTPTQNHLEQARESLRLLNVQADKREHTLAQFRNDFELVDEQVIGHDLSLDQSAQQDLQRMAPHPRSHRTERATQAVSVELPKTATPKILITTAAFRLLVFAHIPM